MGWPPAVVIVVRHGARLDAADKQWHLTSPTPYDPPLTYGGWTQSRALGARIAGILRTRETDDEIPITSSSNPLHGERRKRRHKVVIHTSPFLRCVQTSVAISAGLAQNPGHHRTPVPAPAPASPAIKAVQMHSSASPKIRPTLLTDSPKLAPIPEPTTSKIGSKPHEQPENIKKSTIRVDAFLGEWLSPDYFEQITPPPSSVMMVAAAKADLLRREDYSSLVRDISGGAPLQGFPGGWGSPVVQAKIEKEDDALSNLSSLSQSLPRRERTSSLSSSGSHGSRHRQKSPHIPAPAPGEHGVYKPPIPSYAISSSDPIPAGYVAHSRDACVDVDYQWDSMRDPLNWGDGGEYGEEWSQMHKRFRKGLQHLHSWYSSHDDSGKSFTKIPCYDGSSASKVDEHHDDEEDTDLVIILVTHGAGCNALIGALTNQPVLLDVGMASLTMAVRKPTPPNSPLSTPGHSRASSRTVTISDQYDVKLIANTEHLRTSSVSTPSVSRGPSVSGISAFRERFGNGSSDNRNRPIIPGSFGSIRRTASVASSPRNYQPPRQSSIGLWSAPRIEDDDEEAMEEEPEDDMILNFGNDGPSKENVEVTQSEHREEDENEVAPLGLWGTPRPPGLAEKIREMAPKRRWTVNERG